MQSLSRKQVCRLRAFAHPLSPMVQLGKAGYGPAMAAEVSRNLEDHELVKVRLATDDRDEFYALVDQVAADTQATVVQTIGRTLVLYRRRAKDPHPYFN